MIDYTVTKLRASPIGVADLYEVKLEDGTPFQFVYSDARNGEGWGDAIEQAARKARRNREYLRAKRA